LKKAKYSIRIWYICHAELDQALYYLIGNSIIRVIVLDGLPGNATDKLLAMRPVPSYFVIFADTTNVIKLFQKVSTHWRLWISKSKRISRENTLLNDN
jgi:hypothetical protein